MRKIEIEELKQIQLEILIKVHNFCVSNGINYSLSSGTLLGAIRHKGYIPWDDDIDIYMLRPEFERLEKDFCDPYLRIMSPKLDKNCIYPYGKVYDSRTILVEDVDNSMSNMGVNIDIFVIDSVPDDMRERRRLFRKNKFLETIIMIKTVRLRNGRSLFKNICLLIGKLLLYPIPLRRIIAIKYNLCVPFNPSSNDICNVMAGIGIKACIPLKVMGSFIDIDFEGFTFKCMEDYECYLRVNFGDYMELPPVDKRLSHHVFKAWWK